MSGRPHEPTSPIKPATRGRADSEPPAPPRELGRPATDERRFTVADRTWIARLAGKGACGTGSYGLGLVEAVHFCDAAAPDRPLHEALIARGRFDALYDEELERLLETATPIQLDP